MSLRELGEHTTTELMVMVSTLQRYNAFKHARDLHARAEAGDKLDAKDKLIIEEHYYQELDRLGV